MSCSSNGQSFYSRRQCLPRLLFPAFKDRRRARLQSLPARELTALALIALAPIGVVAINMMTTHVFTHRYILWSAVGIAILSALVLPLFARQNPVVG